eukprot:3258144-Prymnesium_polylepis.1
MVRSIQMAPSCLSVPHKQTDHRRSRRASKTRRRRNVMHTPPRPAVGPSPRPRSDGALNAMTMT